MDEKKVCYWCQNSNNYKEFAIDGEGKFSHIVCDLAIQKWRRDMEILCKEITENKKRLYYRMWLVAQGFKGVPRFKTLLTFFDKHIHNAFRHDVLRAPEIELDGKVILEIEIFEVIDGVFVYGFRHKRDHNREFCKWLVRKMEALNDRLFHI